MRSWFNNAVLTVGVPFEPGQTAASRPVTLYEDKVGEEEKRKEKKGGGVKECCVLHGHVYTCMFVLIHIRSYTIRIMCDCALFRMLANKCLSAVRMLVCV